MGQLYVARRTPRKGLYLSMDGSWQNPALLFLLPSVDPAELDEQIRAQLEKIGITAEADVQVILDKAEADYEMRIKIAEVKREISRLMEIRANGGKLMQSGYRKWKQAFYPAITR